MDHFCAGCLASVFMMTLAISSPSIGRRDILVHFALKKDDSKTMAGAWESVPVAGHWTSPVFASRSFAYVPPFDIPRRVSDRSVWNPYKNYQTVRSDINYPYFSRFVKADILWQGWRMTITILTGIIWGLSIK